MFIKNKELKNAGWLIGGKIIQMVISLFISVFSVRYLGPSNYGIINYVSAYIAFFSSLCTLGINSVIIKNFVDNPKQQGETIGTTLFVRAVSSFLSALMIVAFIAVLDRGDKTILIVAILCSFSLLFQVLDTFNYWFQSRYESKVTAINTLIAYLIVSVYKVVLLILGARVEWFAFAISLDYIVVGVLLVIAYKNHKGPRITFSFCKARELLGKSYHYILSGMMVAIYGQTDKFMLKHMLDDTSVGYYSLATTISSMWVFVLAAIIDSIYPTILQLHNVDQKQYEKKNKQLYAIVFYVSVIASIFFCVFGDIVVQLMYGNEFLPTSNILKIVTWYTAFSYLGVARNAWIVCENKQKYLKYMYVVAAFANVLLNYVLIPLLGAVGAALASLVTQVLTSIVLPCLVKEMRPNAILIIEAIVFRW